MNTELTVNLSPTTVAAQQVGAISWDLPASLQYEPGADLVAEVRVVNVYSAAKVFAVVIRVTDDNGVILDEQILSFSADTTTFQCFEVQPGHAFDFTLTARLNRADVYFGLLLYACKQEDTSWVLDEAVDSVEVWLAGAAGFDFSQLIMLIVPVMMIGLMIPMMTKLKS